MVRVLTFTTLYPNAVQPSHGIFVENRIRHLAASGRAAVKVVAPVPFYPIAGRVLSAYRNKNVPAFEMRGGIEIHHPRYPLMPKLSVLAAPYIMYRAARSLLESIRRGGYTFDLIDAHYFYPDGVAAVMLGRHFGTPVAITARGTDVNVIPDFYWQRRMILWAARHAAGLITVSAALKDRLVVLGVPPTAIRVLRNGIDLAMFRPLDHDAARRRLGLSDPTLLSVGNLVPEKGHDLVIRALPLLPRHRLILVGHGPEEPRLLDLARRLGVADRVRFLGRVAHDELAPIYSAADLLVLASHREGWPNVLLEAMACGTPAVASKVGGVPEIVGDPVAGVLFEMRTPDALSAAVNAVTARRIDRAATRAYAERFGWDSTTTGQLDLFQSILSSPAASRTH